MASFDFASLTPVLSLSKGSGRTVAQTFIPLVLKPPPVRPGPPPVSPLPFVLGPLPFVLGPLPFVLSPLPFVLSPLPFVLSVAER